MQYDYGMRTVGFNGWVLENLPLINEKREPPPNIIPAFLISLVIIAVCILICLGLFWLKKRRDDKLRDLLDEYKEDGETGEQKKKSIHQVDLDDY